MPTWEITEDATGQTLILEGDNAPNESDVIKAFSAFRGQSTIGVPQVGSPWYQPIRDASSFILGRTPDQVAADAQRVAQYGTAEQKAALFDPSGALRVKEGSSLKSDISRGIDQLQGIGYALGAGVADTIGATGTADWMLNRALLNQKQVEANPPDVGAIANIGVGLPSGIEGLGPRLRQSLSFVREAAGENLPMSGPSMGSGAIVGKLTKRLAAKKLAEVASAQAVRQLADAQMKGRVIGVLAPNIGIEAGSIYQDMAREGARGGKEFAVATLAALPAAALDSISDVAGLRRVTGEANRSLADRVMASAFGPRFAKSGLDKMTAAGLEQLITETPTEYIQTGIEQAATFSQSPQLQGMFWQTFLGDKAARERVEAAVKGGVGGGAMGLGIGGIQALRRDDTGIAPEVRPTTPVEPPTEDAQAFSDALDRRVAALDALAAQVAAEEDVTTPTEGVQDAIQEQEPSPQVLRTETPQPAQQLGLQEVAAEVRPTEEETVVQPLQEGGVASEEEIPVQEAKEEVIPQTPAGGQAQAGEVTPSRGAVGTVNYETFDEPTGTWIPSSHRYVVSKSTIAGDKPWRLTVLAGPDDDPVAIGHIQLDSPNVTSRKKQELTEQLGRYVRNLELSERQPPTGGTVATVPPRQVSEVPTPTVAPAVKKARTQIKKVALTPTKEAKANAVAAKSELVQRLEAAKEQAPGIYDDRGDAPLSVTIEIPKDGTFKIHNDKETIQKVLDKVVKIPTSTPKDFKVPVGSPAQKAQRTKLMSQFVLPDDITESDSEEAERQLAQFEDEVAGKSDSDALPIQVGDRAFTKLNPFLSGLQIAMGGVTPTSFNVSENKTVGEARKWLTDRLNQVRSLAERNKSLGERAISAIESIEKKIGEGTYSDPLLLTPLAKLALKLAKQLIRGGMALERAIREAIAQARAQTPDAKDDDAKLGEAMAMALAVPETGPSGQTFTGPTRERDKTSPGQSSFYQSEGPARSEAEDEKLASEQVAAFGDDLDRAYSEAQKINEPAFRQVVLAEILARTMERLEKSNLHDVAMRNLAARLSETFKAEGREAGQALQSRVQANEKLDPYKPLLSWLNLLRTQFEDQVRKPLGPKVGQIEEGINKAARKAVKKKTPKEREAEFDKELDKELEQAGIDKPTRKKIRSKNKKLLDVLNDPNATDEDILRVLGEAFGLETEDGPTAKKLLDLTKKAKKAPEGLPRHKVIQEMMDLVFDKAPVDWHKLIQDIWFGSVLMRLGTFLNVAVGSSTTSVMNLGLQMIDRAARGGDVKGAARIMHQYLVGLLEGARVGVHIAKTGDYSVLPDFQDRADRFFRGQMKPDQLEAMLRKQSLAKHYPGKLAYTRRIMTALDYIFATATRDSSVLYSALTRKDQESVDKLARKWDKTASRLADEQARNELGKDADAAEIAVRRRQILEEGVAEEEKAAAAHLARRVAGNADPQGVPGLLYGFVQAGANWIDQQVPGAGFVTKVITGTPFLRASMNMMQNAMDLFPGVGIAKATLGTGKAPTKFLQRKIFKTTPEEQRMQIVGSLVGTVAAVGIGSLVLLDEDEEKERKFDLTGSWGGFTQQQKKQMMDAGMRPYSFGVKQKDGTTKWISYRQSPLIGVFATIGYLRDHQRKDRKEYNETPKAEWVTMAAIHGALAIKDFSALSGLTSIWNQSAQGIDDPEKATQHISRWLSQAVGRPVSGFIPSVVKELDEFLDPTLYRENGDKITGYWLRNIPLARRAVGEGPDLNIFGEPVKQTRPPLRAYLSSQDSNEPAWRALSHALNNGVFPTYVSETAMVTDGGQRRRMTEPEFYRYREAFGKLMKQRLNADAENLLKLDRPRLEQYFDGRGAIWDSMRVTARQQAFSKK